MHLLQSHLSTSTEVKQITCKCLPILNKLLHSIDVLGVSQIYFMAHLQLDKYYFKRSLRSSMCLCPFKLCFKLNPKKNVYFCTAWKTQHHTAPYYLCATHMRFLHFALTARISRARLHAPPATHTRT